ncbi:MAG: MATE family efflux transporter [Eubacteriales bacterium]|nr:MATE family efflux transporter [Eubacteriales bacterium]
MQNDKTTQLFRDAPVPKAVISNALPAMISMIMVLIYNIADTFFISLTNDALMVAAVSVATPVFLIFMAFGTLFGIGGTSLISRMLGAGNEEKACHISAFCFWTGAGIGVISMIVIWLLDEPICRLVGASTDTIGYASQYLKIIAFSIPFTIIGNTFSNIIRSEGKPQKAMMGMVIGNLLNIVLDPICILVLGWNVAGAAVATVIGNVVSVLFYIVHLTSKNSMLSIRPSNYRAGDGIATGVLSIGIPASLNSVMMSISNIFINNVMAQYGDMAVAGLGVAMKINMIVVMLLIGLGTGIQPLLGYCYGAGNKQRFVAVMKFSLTLALCLSIIMTIICYVFAGPLVTIFLQDPEAYQFGFAFSRAYILSGPILGLLFVFINAIQSTGAALPALILSISRQGLLFLPILYLLNSIFHDAVMVAHAQPLTDYLATALAAILFIITYKKYFKIFDEPDGSAAHEAA